MSPPLSESPQAPENQRPDQEKYRIILENIEEGYYEVDISGNFLFFNDSLVKMLGYSPEEMRGMSNRKYTDAENAEKIYQTFNQVYRSGEPNKGFDWVLIRKDGIRLHVETSVSLILDEKNRKIGFRGIARDVTRRLQAEEEIRKLNEALEQKVRERTRELEAANAKLRELDQMKTDFLSMVSHEIRTPLTSVLGFGKIIRNKLEEVIFPRIDVDVEPVRRTIRNIRDNIQIIILEGTRLTALINDVLDITKMEADKVEWRMIPVFMDEITERAIGATSALFKDKDLELIREMGRVPEVAGDPDRLIQVVVNLLSNAVKFTEKGFVKCRVRQVGEEAVVSVTDTGVGIDKEDHVKIFEKFKQVGDTLTSKPEGTGLGLPICKHIIDRHGGRIWMESERGKGSTFSFGLPLMSVRKGA
jgi:PAS domain S-box-containing protein